MSPSGALTEGINDARLREFRAAQRDGMRIAGSVRDYALGVVLQAYLSIGLYDTVERIRGIEYRGWTHMDGNAGFRMSWWVAGDEPVQVKIAGGE